MWQGGLDSPARIPLAEPYLFGQEILAADLNRISLA
jgi:hypothetical protein